MTRSLHSALAMIDHRTVGGYVRDAACPDRRFVVEILADDVPVAAVLADGFHPALALTGIDDPNHGFVLTLGARHADTTRILSARLANLETAVGNPIDLAGRPKVEPLQAALGAVESAAGALVSGWVAAATGTVVALHATTAGEEVATTVARNWSSRPIGGEMRPVLSFQLHMPAGMGDGRRREVAITTSAGVALAGSPVAIEWLAEGQQPKR